MCGTLLLCINLSCRSRPELGPWIADPRFAAYQRLDVRQVKYVNISGLELETWKHGQVSIPMGDDIHITDPRQLQEVVDILRSAQTRDTNAFTAAGYNVVIPSSSTIDTLEIGIRGRSETEDIGFNPRGPESAFGPTAYPVLLHLLDEEHIKIRDRKGVYRPARLLLPDDDPPQGDSRTRIMRMFKGGL